MKDSESFKTKCNPILRAIKKATDAIGKNGRFLLCVSGGADSSALLHGFHSLGLNFEVVNCNFHLRGKESERDSHFVKNLCKRLGAKFQLLDFDAASYCRRKGISLEMGCRELRYEAFRDIRIRQDFSRIVVAHNAEDNIETFFLNLLRGTGIRGLCGMEEDTGEILRPLLSVTRKEILEYLEEIEADYVKDSSNEEDEFRRNFIRLKILPLLESRWPGAKKAVLTTMDNLRGSEKIVKSVIENFTETKDFISHATLQSLPDRRTALFALFSPLGASPFQIHEMEKAVKSGAYWNLPNGMIRMDSTGFRYFKTNDFYEKFSFKITELTPSSDFFVNVISGSKTNNVVLVPGSFSNYEWTSPTEGMRIHPFGMNGSKKIADVLKEAGVPPHERRNYPLLKNKETSKIIWIPGIRRSLFSLVKSSDEIITQIEIIKNDKENT